MSMASDSPDLLNDSETTDFDQVEDPSLGRRDTDSLLKGTHTGNLIKHMPWLVVLINCLPESMSARWVPGWAGFLRLQHGILEQIDEIKSDIKSNSARLNGASHKTIFHELLASPALPPHEKTTDRLSQDGRIFVQGGTLTASAALALGTFHLLNRPSALRTLREELFASISTPDTTLSLSQLEQLPFLSAVVKEVLRLSLGSSSRISRVAPDETLEILDKSSGKMWYIPPGTPVSMTAYKTLRDPGIFYDPFGFRPERWLDDGARLDKYLVVFCPGTRVCLGMALAKAELFLMLARLFRRWGGGGTVGSSEEGDRRPGDAGVMSIFQTTVRDCEMDADYFIPIPYKVGLLRRLRHLMANTVQGSEGIRVVLEACNE
jgi:cytochrome P450